MRATMFHGRSYEEGILPLKVTGFLVPRLTVEEVLRILHLVDAACFCGHMFLKFVQVFKMSDIEEVTGSQATSKHKLVDTITDPELAWVAPEPRGIASTITAQDPRLFTVVEEAGLDNWEVHTPAEGERVCSAYTGGAFTMYKMAFKEMGFRLPFNDLEAGIFGRLKVAPSQLHPNSLAFIRAYQILCRYLEVEAIVALFFYIFQIQRQRVGDRQGWISLKHQSSKIFKMFFESARGFKERYYVVKPMTEFALNSLHMERPVFLEDGSPQLDEEGEQV
ncbi:hypothetical protein L195_g032380, partial [Trifolium pratense]